MIVTEENINSRSLGIADKSRDGRANNYSTVTIGCE